MDAAHRKQIEEIIDGMFCPKDFQCAESGFENLCRARDVGLASLLQCLEADPQDCPFAQSFDDATYCHCPLRVYLAKKLSKSQ